MATYKYTPYFRNDSPSRSEPLREELSPEDIEHRLQLFVQDVRTSLEDVRARVDIEDERIISVTTDLSRTECDEKVACCLSNLGLYAKKI
jgi:hypothetical protein